MITGEPIRPPCGIYKWPRGGASANDGSVCFALPHRSQGQHLRFHNKIKNTRDTLTQRQRYKSAGHLDQKSPFLLSAQSALAAHSRPPHVTVAPHSPSSSSSGRPLFARRLVDHQSRLAVEDDLPVGARAEEPGCMWVEGEGEDAEAVGPGACSPDSTWRGTMHGPVQVAVDGPVEDLAAAVVGQVAAAVGAVERRRAGPSCGI